MTEQETKPAGLTDVEKAVMEARAVEQIETCFDPEIPVNIYQLGLIYAIDVRDDRTIHVTMTLTSPNCPAAEFLPSEVYQKVAAIEGVEKVFVDVVWEPTWTPDRMSEAAKLALGFL